MPLAGSGIHLAQVPNNIIERFDNMGIFTLGPLLSLPSKQLGRRFGKALLTYIAQLTGDLPDPREAIHPEPTFEQQLHLLKVAQQKADLYETALSPMAQLAHELQHWLVAHQKGCTRIVWRFFSYHRCVEVSMNFASGKQNAGDMLALSRLKMEHTELPEEVLSVGIEAADTVSWSNHSANLFQQDTPDNACALDTFTLIDELNARLGEDACCGLLSADQHAPELAAQTFSFASTQVNGQTNLQGHFKGNARQRAIHNTHGNSEPGLATRPLWLFENPQPTRREDLDLLNGPERVQSNWWQATVSRDYYVAQHRSGAECWTYQDADGTWYLHGYFS